MSEEIVGAAVSTMSELGKVVGAGNVISPIGKRMGLSVPIPYYKLKFIPYKKKLFVTTKGRQEPDVVDAGRKEHSITAKEYDASISVSARMGSIPTASITVNNLKYSTFKKIKCLDEAHVEFGYKEAFSLTTHNAFVGVITGKRYDETTQADTSTTINVMPANYAKLNYKKFNKKESFENKTWKSIFAKINKESKAVNGFGVGFGYNFINRSLLNKKTNVVAETDETLYQFLTRLEWDKGRKFFFDWGIGGVIKPRSTENILGPLGNLRSHIWSSSTGLLSVNFNTEFIEAAMREESYGEFSHQGRPGIDVGHSVRVVGTQFIPNVTSTWVIISLEQQLDTQRGIYVLTGNFKESKSKSKEGQKLTEKAVRDINKDPLESAQRTFNEFPRKDDIFDVGKAIVKDPKGTVVDVVTSLEEPLPDPDVLRTTRLGALELQSTTNADIYGAEVITPCAGENYGVVFPIEDKSQVLVGYFKGDRARPVVLGQLWTKDQLPPALLYQKDDILLMSKGGAKIILKGTGDVCIEAGQGKKVILGGPTNQLLLGGEMATLFPICATDVLGPGLVGQAPVAGSISSPAANIRRVKIASG